MNTLLTYQQQLALVEKKLAVVSRNEELGLDTFKYHRRVMYDYLWQKHPECMECRGHTYDYRTGELVLAAPRKSFNYLEDGWWKDVPLDTRVTAFKKFNGFMATMSVYKGQVIVGTTGSTKSDFVGMAIEKLSKEWDFERASQAGSVNETTLFEIIHENDPHIVNEEVGTHYLGYRDKQTGKFEPAGNYQWKSLGDMIEVVKKVKHEGYMLYDREGNVCKLKSPYYVGKKKLMRANKDRVNQMYVNPQQFLQGMPEMWHPVVVKIVQTLDMTSWLDYSEQHRRQVLEDFLT